MVQPPPNPECGAARLGKSDPALVSVSSCVVPEGVHQSGPWTA